MIVTIEKMVFGGDGLARHKGRVVLAPLVLPDERVRIETVKEEPRLVRGRVAEILESSPRRVAPACPVFARCGGCQYQHASYEDQVGFKSVIFVETLKRIGKFSPPAFEILSAEPWNYRNRVQFKAARRNGDVHIGYYERGARNLVDTEQCPVASPGINSMLPALRELGRRPDFPANLIEIEILDGGDQALISIDGAASFPETLVSAFQERLPAMASLAVNGRVYGRGHLIYNTAEFAFRISHGVFFQVNRFLLDRLSARVTGGLEGGLALDLYAGAGFFTLPLAQRFERVIAVEANVAAARDLESSCARASIGNVQVAKSSTETFLARTKEKPDMVLLDPPRTGLDPRAAAALEKIAPPRIVYVSCDPATLARDLARLLGAGYRLKRLHLVDLFPQTFHLESIAVLEK